MATRIVSPRRPEKTLVLRDWPDCVRRSAARVADNQPDALVVGLLLGHAETRGWCDVARNAKLAN